jgi:hypothetical protein
MVNRRDPYPFCLIKAVPESLACRFLALKGLPMVARGKRAQRPPPRGYESK